MLFSGKSPFDFGSKEMCDIVPGVHFLTINLDRQDVAYIGLCIYEECKEEYINSVEDQVLKLIV